MANKRSMAYFDQRGIEQNEAKGKQCLVKGKRKKEVDWTFKCIINMETDALRMHAGKPRARMVHYWLVVIITECSARSFIRIAWASRERAISFVTERKC